MAEILATLGAWSWFIAAVLLMIAEVLAPGAFMLWLGIAAFIVGVISFGVDWGWQAQLIAFAVFAVAAIPVWRKVGVAAAEDEAPFLNRRTEAMVGQVFTVETPIANGVGTVRVGDTVWRVSGADAPAGAKVRVTSVDGASLTVAPV